MSSSAREASAQISCRRCVPGKLQDPLRLHLLAQSGLLEGENHPSLDRLTSLAQDLTGAPTVLVSLVEENRQVFPSHVGLSGEFAEKGETPLSHSFCQHVVTSGAPLIIDDARTDERVKDNLAIKDLQVISYAGFPIVSREQVLGSFCAIRGEPHSWEQLELDVLEQFSLSVSDQVELHLDMVELRRTRRQLELANQDLQNFASTLSHDLKAPLRGIRGCLQLLEMQLAPLDDEAVELMQHVQDSAGRMGELIDALRGYSKALVHREEKSWLSLDDLLSDVERDLDESLNSCGGRILRDTELGLMEGYPPVLRQLYQNLISNGLKFQPPGQVPVINVGRDQDGTFYVKDNGIGLDPRYHERVFKLYSRAENSEEYEGMGMGLAICARAASKHNGKVWLKSAAGEGMTAYFTLKPDGFQVPVADSSDTNR